MQFCEIQEALFDNETTTGYTFSHNKLEDLLLRILPNDYYCFWRYIWRKTYGWQINADFLSLRDISEATHIPAKDVSRIAWFFHTTQLIRYTPGKKDQTNSRFELFPAGAPDIGALERMLAVLQPVLEKEKHQRAQDKNFRYRNGDFRSELAAVWKGLGGAIDGNG